MPRLCEMPDVLVIGGGVAALTAAIEAAEAGATVRLVDQAPASLAGGNTRHSRNFRYAHARATPFTPDVYDAESFRADVLRATQGQSNPALLQVLSEQSDTIPAWLQRHGVALQPAQDGKLPYSRKTAFFLGGGMAAVRALYDRARALGVQVDHEVGITALALDGGRILAATGEQGAIAANAFVLACGGAHADPNLLLRHWGDAAAGFINRGTPHGQGELLQWLLAQGGDAAGDPARLYLVAVDARSPPHDGGIVTRIRGMPLGIVVDRNGRRRHDEGADTASTRYARWGRRLAAFPGQVGWLILDAMGLGVAPATLYPPVMARSIAELAASIGVDASRLVATLAEYNASLISPSEPAHAAGWRTSGLEPPKSAHALPIAEPPFAAFPMRPGVTFSHHGIAVDARTRIRWRHDEHLDNGFAAGMIMAASLIPCGYVSGLAVTIGLVFGRIAGREAANHALG